MPTLDAPRFSVLLQEFGRCQVVRLNVLVRDNVATHRVVEGPENAVLLFLPGYSPELNPMEWLWRAVRARFDVFVKKVARERGGNCVEGGRGVSAKASRLHSGRS